ncbi:MAG: hypothetical protein QW763_03275 [Archaeoglobaceae archaeon]
MDVYFNGNFVGTFILKKDWNVYNVTIPQEFTQIGVNYLDFRYKYAESPKDYDIKEDARKLAVALDKNNITDNFINPTDKFNRWETIKMTSIPLKFLKSLILMTSG